MVENRADMYALNKAQARLTELDQDLLRRKLRITESPCDTSPLVNGQRLKAFCSNDYLGLANHPELIAALAEGAKRYGVGSGASHLISGHSIAHENLERALATLQAPYIPHAKALFFCTGYLANLSAITALASLENDSASGSTTIYSGKLNHASLIDGVRLAAAQTKASTAIFDHHDLLDLEHKLKLDAATLKIIVTDGVFSMDGDLAPLTELLALAERYDALLIVDDAHGFGVLGDEGCGILEALDLHSQRLIYIGTLGKAAGISGAFICGQSTLIEYILQKARPYIYSTATPPAIAHALLSSLQLITSAEGRRRRQQLCNLIAIWQAEMVFSSWQKMSSNTAIQPIVLGENRVALAVSQWLSEAGYWIPAIRPPTVPNGSARLRVTFSASHTVAELRALISTLQQIELKVLASKADLHG
ncbi:BioF 7-keto-8-aminopelargonate synthetase and related enzymes [Burkholderiaceae bacterium]